mmetsp:Transcript_156040/g.500418  ORF Transcript_156040/g.500418 Transcript_156040/m.500418 type:complete len:287 (+) Transcript_156040:135-995(+)
MARPSYLSGQPHAEAEHTVCKSNISFFEHSRPGSLWTSSRSMLRGRGLRRWTRCALAVDDLLELTLKALQVQLPLTQRFLHLAQLVRRLCQSAVCSGEGGRCSSPRAAWAAGGRPPGTAGRAGEIWKQRAHASTRVNWRRQGWCWQGRCIGVVSGALGPIGTSVGCGRDDGLGACSNFGGLLVLNLNLLLLLLLVQKELLAMLEDRPWQRLLCRMPEDARLSGLLQEVVGNPHLQPEHSARGEECRNRELQKSAPPEDLQNDGSERNEGRRKKRHCPLHRRDGCDP